MSARAKVEADRTDAGPAGRRGEGGADAGVGSRRHLRDMSDWGPVPVWIVWDVLIGCGGWWRPVALGGHAAKRFAGVWLMNEG